MTHASTFLYRPQPEKLFLAALVLVLTLMPLAFIFVLSLSEEMADKHVETRLHVILLLQLLVFAAVGFVTNGFRDLFSAFSLRVYLLLAALFGIALSKLILDVGDLILTQQRIGMWLGHILFGLAAYTIMRRFSAEVVLRLVAGAIIFGTLFFVIYVMLFHFAVLDASVSGGCSRKMPGFGNMRYTGYFVAIALALSAAMASRHELDSALRVTFGALAVVFWYFILYSGSRGAIFGLAGAVAVLGCFQHPRITVRLIVVVLLTAVVGFVLIKIFPPVGCRGLNVVQRTIERAEVSKISSGRFAIWQTTWDLILDRPWFGNGEIRLRHVSDIRVTQPHNSILQTLFAWGLIGAGIFWVLLGEYVLRLLLALRRMSWQAQPLLFAILTVLAYSLLDATLYYSYPLALLAVLFAAVGAIWRNAHDNNVQA